MVPSLEQTGEKPSSPERGKKPRRSRAVSRRRDPISEKKDPKLHRKKPHLAESWLGQLVPYNNSEAKLQTGGLRTIFEAVPLLGG